jgi:hypothetical protein
LFALRISILAVGIVFLAIGLVFMEVPLFSQSSCSGTMTGGAQGSPAPEPVTCKVSSSLMPLTIAISWSTTGAGFLNISLCTKVVTENLSGNIVTYLSQCTSASPGTITNPSGSSGTITFTASGGDYIDAAFTPSGSSSASVSAKSNLPLVGLPIAIFGAVVVVLGIILRSPSKDEEPKTEKPVEGESKESQEKVAEKKDSDGDDKATREDKS